METQTNLKKKIKELQYALKKEKEKYSFLLSKYDKATDKENLFDKKLNDIQTELTNKNYFIENLNRQITKQLQLTTFLNEITKVAISKGNLKNTLETITGGITSTMKIKKIAVYFFDLKKMSMVLAEQNNFNGIKKNIPEEIFSKTNLKKTVFNRKGIIINSKELKLRKNENLMCFPLVNSYKISFASLTGPARDTNAEEKSLNTFGIILAGFGKYDAEPNLKDIEDFSPIMHQVSIILNSAVANERIKEQSKIITAQYNRMEKELELSRQVQMSILPKTVPVFEKINIAVKFIPTGYVGGDFFDIVKIDKNKIGFLVADVSGHGVPAAFMATISKIIFNNCVKLSASPKEIVKELNKNLYYNFKLEHYLTLFFGILNVKTGEFTYTKAGHPPALLFSKDKVKYLDADGLFVGPFKDGMYEQKTVTLSEGDAVFLYTDGIVEGTDKNSKEYGLQKIIDRIKIKLRQNSATSLNKILNGLIADYLKFTRKKMDDDITGVLIKYSSKTLKKRIQMKNDVYRIKTVINKIFKDSDKFDFSGPVKEQLRLIIEETLVNAVAHGNKNRKDKKVFISYEITNEKIKLKIKDEGKGFNYNNLPSPRNEKFLKNIRGRGIFLIKNLTDSVSFNELGNEIEIIKYNNKPLDFNK